MLSCLTFSKQLEINIVHGMWSYSLIEVRFSSFLVCLFIAEIMPVQRVGKLWRARRKKGGTTYCGPRRATEAAAAEDQQHLDAAAAVSMERLQEAHGELLRVLPAASAASVASADAQNWIASVAKHRDRWRLRVRVGKKEVCGPSRQSEGEAEQDCRQLNALRHLSAEAVQSVVAQMHQEVADAGAARDREVWTASVAKHRDRWRLRVRVSQKEVRGPSRQSEGEAEQDCRRLNALRHLSAEEVQSVVAQMHQEAADAEAARDREVHFKEIVLAEMRNCLGLQQPQKRPRQRARNVSDEVDFSAAAESARLLVTAYQEVVAAADSSAGRMLLETGDLMDQVSRPLGTAGFEEAIVHTGLKNLRNSCWLNAVLQCFYACVPLRKAFRSDSIIGSMVTEVLRQLDSKQWDYVAPFRLLAQLYSTYGQKLSAERGADAGEACQLLLERCSYGPGVQWNLETAQTDFGEKGLTVAELTQSYFDLHCFDPDELPEVLVFHLNPVDNGKVNWAADVVRVAWLFYLLAWYEFVDLCCSDAILCVIGER